MECTEHKYAAGLSEVYLLNVVKTHKKENISPGHKRCTLTGIGRKSSLVSIKVGRKI